MCLIITKPADAVFTHDFLEGVYYRNQDGVGVMYAENENLYYAKMVPTTFQDVLDFWAEYVEGRECAVHFRMQTHGDINHTNCHPYEVLSGGEEGCFPLYLMHNGVLHTGNNADKTLSDTWHYINDYLRPMLIKNPDFFTTKAFEEIVAAHIGTGNKFVLLDAYGRMVTINAKSGVMHNGAWLSNTYAWDAPYNRHPTSWGYSSATEAAVFRDGYEYYSIECSADDDEDALVFAEELFETLERHKLTLAYSDIQWTDAENYYNAVGDEDAYRLLDCIEAGFHDDDSVLAEIRKVTDKQHAEGVW